MRADARLEESAKRAHLVQRSLSLGAVIPQAMDCNVEGPLPVGRVISGCQTGVDRAALDWAIARRIPHGGWCPNGRRAEDGTIPSRYAMRETASRGYAERTRRNVEDSAATLILNLGALDGGTRRTVELCERLGKPHLVVQLDRLEKDSVSAARAWLLATSPATLNIAGPREGKRHGAYECAIAFLEAL